MPMRQPTLSVILPTHSRVARLRQAVDALLRQAGDPGAYEVVVVDNNRSDGTADFLSGIDDPRLHVIHERRRGLSNARNAGLSAARGPIVAFTGDEVEVAPDWVSTVISALRGHPELDGVGGRVLPAWEGRRPHWLTRAHWAPLALQDHGDCRRIFDRHMPIGLIGANVAFRARVFDRVGVFSADTPRIGDGIGSTADQELLTRLYEAGGRMLYTPRMLARALVQPDRYERKYHRRWHEGHGRFEALMRSPGMEAARLSLLGVPSHLVGRAVSDATTWFVSALHGDWDGAFAAELRLRFFSGFVRARLAP
jgi:glycosyltransferase involved in cell wall biosynthesis